MAAKTKSGKQSASAKRSVKSWPADGAWVSADELVEGIVRLLRGAYELKRKPGPVPQYVGYNIGASELATQVGINEDFQANMLEYHRERNRDVLDVAAYKLLCLGIEQGRRLHAHEVALRTRSSECLESELQQFAVLVALLSNESSSEHERRAAMQRLKVLALAHSRPGRGLGPLKAGWELHLPKECDLCDRPAIWRHPDGGFRCDKCPTPKGGSS